MSPIRTASGRSSTGAVTTLADDTGLAVYIHSPAGIAADGAGSVYVADTSTDRYGYPSSAIRKVGIAKRTVTTIADRTGVSIRFDDMLSDVAIDGSGNLFVADGSTIKKVVVATGVVTTLAGAPGMWGSVDGTGADARLGMSMSSGIAVDGAGNLFVADGDVLTGNTVRKVVVTGAVTTLAGKSAVGGSEDEQRRRRPLRQPDRHRQRSGGQPLRRRYLVQHHPQGRRRDRRRHHAGGRDRPVRRRGRHRRRRTLRQPTGHRQRRGGQPLRRRQLGPRHPEGRRRDRGRHHVRGRPGGKRGRHRRRRELLQAVRHRRRRGGNLFVTDMGNSTVRKIVIATGAVTTLAGAPDQSPAAPTAQVPPPIFFPQGRSPPTEQVTCSSSTATASGRSSSRPVPSPRSRARPASRAA